MVKRAIVPALVLVPWSLYSQVQSHDITCENGSGEYSTRFVTGITVTVGPLRRGAFAQRACAARLAWGSAEITVASDAEQVGIDVLGADLGFGMPVAAFQIDETGDKTDRSYQIYALTKPPRLLYTITGADSYAAADTDLDGQVEIWADDAAALNGLEGVPLQSFDFAPAVALRFEKKRLVDASSEFQSFYDAQIADLRSRIDPQQLAAFKQSDGALSLSISRPGEERRRLAGTRIKVLEIVCGYLYSGRAAEAWSALHDMWPSQDFNRIQAGLLEVRQRGILRGIDRAREPRRKSQVHIYDASGGSGAVARTVVNPSGGAPDTTDLEPAVVPPKSILLRRPPPDEVEEFHAADAAMELVVDASGKVRSAKLLNGAGKHWIEASAGWHFIPALRDGRPVACRFRLSVWDLK